MDAVAAPRPLLQGLIPPEDDPEVAALPISCRSASGDGGVLLAQRPEAEVAAGTWPLHAAEAASSRSVCRSA